MQLAISESWHKGFHTGNSWVQADKIRDLLRDKGVEILERRWDLVGLDRERWGFTSGPTCRWTDEVCFVCLAEIHREYVSQLRVLISFGHYCTPRISGFSQRRMTQVSKETIVLKQPKLQGKTLATHARSLERGRYSWFNFFLHCQSGHKKTALLRCRPPLSPGMDGKVLGPMRMPRSGRWRRKIEAATYCWRCSFFWGTSSGSADRYIEFYLFEVNCLYNFSSGNC